MIRFILETVSSKIDRNGNRYHFVIVTSTKTGNSFKSDIGGQSNARGKIRSLLGLGWEDFLSIESEIPIREWNRAAKDFDYFEHELTKKAFLDLEKK